MHKLSHLEMSMLLREEFEKELQGSGVTWNLKGILTEFDQALARTAFRVVEIELQEAP